MQVRTPVRYFADENALGMARLLIRAGRTDVVHPGHPHIPEIPRGCDDVDWLRISGQRGWIVLSRDRRIRSRPAELGAHRDFGVRSVWFGGKHDSSPSDLAELFVRSELRLTRVSHRLGAGPWAVTMTSSGIRQITLPER